MPLKFYCKNYWNYADQIRSLLIPDSTNFTGRNENSSFEVQEHNNKHHTITGRLYVYTVCVKHLNNMYYS